MTAQDVISELQSQGFILTPEAIKLILESSNPQELAAIGKENSKYKIIIDSQDLVKKYTRSIAHETGAVVEKTDFKPLAKDIKGSVNVVSEFRPEDSGSLGQVEDFVDYFRNRYEQLSALLRQRGEGPLVPIKDLMQRKNMHVRIIGMLSEKKNTKNGHVILNVEDSTGMATALILSSNNQLIKQSEMLILDEVVCIEGRQSKELFIVDSVLEPELPLRETKTTSEEICLAMLSDMHIGSRLFMRKNFSNFLAWLNGDYGDEKQRELAGRVKYITIAGDLCDGIGIYPGQEKELEITDVFEQYEAFEDLMLQIPEYIHVIVAPGDHDAVKHADPQPRLRKELVPRLSGLDNFTFISSPGTVELHGLKTIVYHGTSIVDFISNIPGMSFEAGAKAMVEMLKKRHLHPFYSGKPITPEKHDYLTIKEAPDIFHTGESHNNSYEVYKGTVCINSGTWQDITDYIISQGLKATPCVLPIVDMRRAKINVLHFDKPLV